MNMTKVATAYVRYNGSYRLTSLYRDPVGRLVVRLGSLYYLLYAVDNTEPVADAVFGKDKGKIVAYEFDIKTSIGNDALKRVTVEIL